MHNIVVKKIVSIWVVLILVFSFGMVCIGCENQSDPPEIFSVILNQSTEYTADSYIQEVTHGGTATFKLTAAPGYVIIGSTVGTYKNGTLTVEDVRYAVTIHIKTAKILTPTKIGLHYTITTESEFGEDLVVGKTGTILIKPDKDYFIEEIKANNVLLVPGTKGCEQLVDGSIKYTATMPESLKLSVHVLGDEYTLILNCNNDKGLAVLSVPVGTVHYGDEVTLRTTPNSGCRLNYIKINGESVTGSVYSFRITENTTVDVNFIDATAVGLSYNANGGTIIGDLNEGNYGPNVTFNIDDCFKKISRPGYVLTGMNTKSDGTGENHSLGAMIWIYTEPVTLYAQWAKETPKTAFTYYDSGTKIKITGLKDNTLKNIVIPENIDGKPVTEISENAFQNSVMTELIISSNVTTIGASAFSACSSLKKVMLFDFKETQPFPSNIFAGCDPDIRIYVNATSKPDKSDLYIGSIADRYMNIKRNDRAPQLITLSGSSGSCGIDPQAVIKNLGMEPNIFGVSQELGLRTQVSIIAPMVRQGDIVVLCPEYFDTAYANEEGHLPYNYAYLNRNYDMIPFLNYTENVKVLNDLGMKFRGKRPGVIGSDQYKIGEYGQRNTVRTPQKDDWFATNELVKINKNIIGKGIEIIKKYAAIMRANGAKVYFSFPPANSNGFDANSKSLETRQDFVKTLRIALDGEIPIISDMEDYFWRGNYFSDSNYHLSNAAATVRTNLLIDDIKAQLALEQAI